jgi:formate hydrogenlyase subunit 3/multisubunit Na+/H+ antiporter MnhD subunit
VIRGIGIVLLWAVAVMAGILAVAAVQASRTLLVLPASVPYAGVAFGATPAAAPFLALLSVLGAAVGLWSCERGGEREPLVIAGFTASMTFVLCATTLAAFFLSWEAMSLISAVLVATSYQKAAVRRSALLYLILAQGGALCILAALAMLAINAGSGTFDAMRSAAPALPPGARDIVFALALAGFGSKAGIVPLHFWLPRAHPVAPAQASALLSGAMINVALYGLTLVTFQLAAPAEPGWGLALLIAGSVTAVLGVLYAVVERDLKRLLAYSSVENVGIVAIGLGIAAVAQAANAPVLAALALAAATFHALNHGLFKSLLFLGAGTVAESQHTVDLERLGGLWPKLRWSAPSFLVGCSAISALPPLNGFASEWLILRSAIATFVSVTVPEKLALLVGVAALMLAGGLAAACFVKAFGSAFLGRPRDADLPAGSELLGPAPIALGVLASVCVALGLAPLGAVTPLLKVSTAIFGAAAQAPSQLSLQPIALLAGPALCVFAALLLARRRPIRSVPTWTCGSPVTPNAQYTPTAFSKPLRTVFRFVFFPIRERLIEQGRSPWFPARIVYRTTSRYLIDEAAASFAAFALTWSRRTRIVQSGSLRLYLAYALAAVFIVVLVAH